MKLVFPEIESIIRFSNANFPAVIIENPGLFYRFVDDLYLQCCGEDGESVLSIGENPIPIAGNLDLLSAFFPFEINRKILLNKIISQMEKQATSSAFYERSQQLLGTVEKLIYDLAFQNDLELEPARLSIASLLKSSGIMLKEDYPNLAEKLLVYMDLMSDYGLASVFVLVNLRAFMDEETIELFTDSCCRKEYNILLLDNKAYKKLTREERLIIDRDLCEI